MQSLQRVELSSTAASLNKLQERGHVTCGNLPAIFLTTPLQHKSQRNLHCVKVAVELDSTSCNDCRDFLMSLPVASRDCNV